MRVGFIARPVLEDFEFAALKSFPCVELNIFEDLSPLERAGEIRNWRQKYCVDLSTVALFGRNYLSADAGERQRSLDALHRVIDFAEAVGAPIVTAGAGANPALSAEERLQQTLDVLGPAVERTRSLGMRFALYNCHWENWISGPEAWEAVFRGLPDAGIKFDPSHPAYAGEDWASQLAAWGHKVIHVHAKDTVFVNGKPLEDVPAGLGDTQWGRLFALLYHHGYAGDINIEPHSRTWQGDRLHAGILLARRHLEQFLLPQATATVRDVVPKLG
jgi:sugar phosphate isomerase/epimerase